MRSASAATARSASDPTSSSSRNAGSPPGRTTHAPTIRLLRRAIDLALRRATRRLLRPVRGGIWLGAALVGLSDGTNDGQKAMGLIAGTLLAAASGGLVFAWPLFRLMDHPVPSIAWLGQLGLALFIGMFAGVIPVTMVEAFPARVRCSAVSIGYNLCLGIIGGTTPLVATWLIQRTHDDLTGRSGAQRTGRKPGLLGPGANRRRRSGTSFRSQGLRGRSARNETDDKQRRER